MTPDERQLLSGLFDRIRSAGTNQQRDRDAESFISDAVRQQPYAPYLLSQTVIVQEQALKAANERLQELEAKVQSLESGQGQGQSGGGESFLGGIGRSIFGGGSSQQQQPRSAPPAYPPQGQYGQNQPQYAQPQGGPWGGAAQAPQAAAPSGGGGFLKGALGMAAGVAGGALLGNAVSGLFHGSNNPFGIASGMGGMGGMGGGFGGGGGETIVNNYYEGDGPGNDGGYDQASDQGGFDNAADFGDDGGFDGGGGDDSYNV